MENNIEPAGPLDRDVRGWQPIETAPKDGRQLILLKTPYSPDGTRAYSNTWWIGGFSVECKPTHWMPLPEAPNVELTGAAPHERKTKP